MRVLGAELPASRHGPVEALPRCLVSHPDEGGPEVPEACLIKDHQGVVWPAGQPRIGSAPDGTVPL